MAARRRPRGDASPRPPRATRSTSSRWPPMLADDGAALDRDPAVDPRADRRAARPASGARSEPCSSAPPWPARSSPRGAVCELSPDEERADVDAGCSASCARTCSPPSPGREDAYRFRHVLIRDAAYAAIAEGAARGAARAVRRLDREHERRQGRRARRDHRLPPRAGVPLPRAARARSSVADEPRWRERAGDARPRRAAARTRATTCRPRSTCSIAPSRSPRPGEPAQLELRARAEHGALWSVGELARAESLLDGLIEAAEATGDRRSTGTALLERAGRLSVTHPEAESELLETRRERGRSTIFEELGDDLGLARAWRRISRVAPLRCRFATAPEAGEDRRSCTRAAPARAGGVAARSTRSARRSCTGPRPPTRRSRAASRSLAESRGAA